MEDPIYPVSGVWFTFQPVGWMKNVVVAPEKCDCASLIEARFKIIMMEHPSYEVLKCFIQ